MNADNYIVHSPRKIIIFFSIYRPIFTRDYYRAAIYECRWSKNNIIISFQNA